MKAALSAAQTTAWKGEDVAGKSVVDLARIIKSSGKVNSLGALSSRFCVNVDPAEAAGFVQAAFTELTDADALADAWVKVVDVLNVPLYEEWKEDTKVALESIRNRVSYTRLDAHGPKFGEISAR